MRILPILKGETVGASPIFKAIMSHPSVRRLQPTAQVWPDRWLADAAIRRGMPAAARLGEFPSLPTAWEALIAAGAVDDAVLDLACMVSATKPADLSRVGPADALLMSRTIAERFSVVPLGTDGPTIIVASANPLSSTLERDLSHATRRRIHIVTASPSAIAAALGHVYGEGATPAGAMASAPSLPAAGRSPDQPLARRASLSSLPAVPGRDLMDEQDAAKSKIANMLDEIFADALREEASDVHFEPREDGLLVRFRVDGALYDARRIPVEQSAHLVRRIKVVSTLDITDTLRPQDGRLSIAYEGRNIDMRVSTLPLGGAAEKVVVRILDSRVAARDLDVIGYTARELARVKRLLELPEGLILVTGPTGSGKTSTLYAAVRHVHRADLNVVTVEDPIEYRIDGINQVQVNEKARMTFAASLRSILRQDPDVVLVGEMRDAETASIAVKASMTGHLVLSTLHASDAVSTLDRLYGMDIDTGALSGALKGIIGQRLVRKLCDNCAEPVTLSDLPVNQQHLLMGRPALALRRPVGCSACRGTGYHGRTIVAEIFIVTPTLQRAIARRADVSELTDLARECGTISMWESGLDRVLAGVTSLYELLDNVAAPIVEADAAQADVDALLAQLLARPVSHPAAPAVPLPDIGEGIGDADPFISRPAAGASSGSASSPAVAIASRPRVAPGGGLRVLLVDDAHAERRRLADALTSDGFTVLEAADGEAALSYARRLRPDVIVTEVALPRLDAVGLLQALAVEQIGTRLLVHTRQTDRELHAWLLELGAEEVMSRTVDARVLGARLRARAAVSAA